MAKEIYRGRSDEELLKTLIENEYSGLDDVLDYDDYKVTIHD